MNFSSYNIKNLNDIEDKVLTKSHLIADKIVQFVGSWKFIIVQTAILAVWGIFNLLVYFEHWDPYPFTLLNLIMSLQAAYTAPIIMMCQNRQSSRDRLEAHNDYLIDLKSEREIRIVLDRLDEQEKRLVELREILLERRYNKEVNCANS